jgi:hypothetical protein
VLSACERLTQGLVGRRIRIIALHVAQQGAELVERRGVESPMLFKTRPYPRPEFIHIFRRPGHADYRHVQVAVFNHGLQRREDLLESEISRSAEKNECIRLWNIHGVTLLVGLRRCVLDTLAGLENVRQAQQYAKCGPIARRWRP